MSFKVCAMLLAIAASLLGESAAQRPAEDSNNGCHPGQYRFTGTVVRGQSFSHRFDGFVLTLVPTEFGWSIDISHGKQHYLANMTGPRHFVPNPIEIEGWHFRNAANTGPNTGDVNALMRHAGSCFRHDGRTAKMLLAWTRTATACWKSRI